MRRWLPILLACLMLTGSALAEMPEGELIVGSTTALSGDFFTDMWGNNTSDIDVRTLLHACDPVYWAYGTNFVTVDSVLASATVMDDQAGNRTYTLTLQPGLRYSDGSAITAADYAFSILLQSSPQMAALGANTTGRSYLMGYDAFAAGTASVLSGVRLLSELSFSLTVKAEMYPYFYELSLISVNPYPIAVLAPGCEVADDGDGAYIRNADAAVAEPIFTAELLAETVLDPETGYRSHPSVTSGPYRLTAYDAETRTAHFEINPYYPGDYTGQKPTIEQICLRTVTADTMIDELREGKVHLLNKCAYSQSQLDGLTLMQTGAVRGAAYLRSGYGFLAFACEQGPAQFAAVRKAVSHCLDKPAFIEQYLSTFGLEVDGYYGLGQWMVQLVNGTLEVQMETDEEIAAWAEVNLEGLTRYAFDTQAARTLLIEDGWTLNVNGEPYTEGVDAMRCKRVDGELMPLILRLAKTDTPAANLLVEPLTAPLAEAGIALETVEMDFPTLLRQYYRQDERAYDMAFLATNFTGVFDPSRAYQTGDAYQGVDNTTGLRDERLLELAMDMRSTQSEDLLGYCQKWVRFQEYWTTLLPTVPIYSNMYFDFYITELADYLPDANYNWPAALLYARLEEGMEEPAELPEGGAEEGEITILD